MIRKLLPHLVLTVFALVALMVSAEPAAAQPGGARGGGGIRGGPASGGAFQRGVYPNHATRPYGLGARRFAGFGFYPYGFGWGYDPFDYGYWDEPDFAWDPSPFYVPAVVPVPERTVTLSGEFPAALTLEFPAPAEVWVDGTKLDGAPDTVRTIRSPDLPAGQSYTFRIKAEWTVKGQTYEYRRDATVEAGGKSRLLVVSGTAIGGK
jgi:uncharacterized protein (TIGR03000 family)